VAPKIGRTDRIQNRRIRFLSKDQETRLLGSYAGHVQPIAEALCFLGLRVGEAEGGWKSLRMVERYGTVSAEHRARAMKKLK
jgi:hypothetical protein